MGYTALVYVHGIGEQQRYFELARLVERLEQYAAWHEATAGGHGAITSVTTEFEPDRIRAGSKRTFLRIRRGETEVRAYEGYWAPHTAGGRSATGVARWILRQWPAPLRGLKGLICDKRFDLRHRRHVAMLYEYLERRRNPRSRFPVRAITRLLQAYHDFIEKTAQGKSEGSTHCFIEYCKRQDRRIARIAEAWTGYVIRRELIIFATLTGIVIGIALLVASLAVVVLRALDVIPEPIRPLLLPPPGSGLNWGASGWWQAVQFVLLTFLMFGGGRFLSRYLGDVQVWTTYQETEQDYRVRAQIVEEMTDLFRHILEDRQCQSLVVVGHSLGTSIAFEALIALRQLNETFGNPKINDRIDHFITLGSPIDKIHYFFTYDINTSPRFEQTIERLRGDLADPPFAVPDVNGCRCRRSRPNLHWINIYDRADIIAGPLHSPSARLCAAHRVDNLELALLWCPVPARSHLAYFDDRRVLQILYGAIFDREYAFARAPRRLALGPDTEAMFLELRSERRPWVTIAHSIFLMLPWLGGLAWVLARAGLALESVPESLLLLTAALFALIFAAELCPLKPRYPLKPASGGTEPSIRDRAERDRLRRASLLAPASSDD